MTDVSPFADADLAPEPHGRRSARDTWLGVAVVTFSASQGFALTGSILLLTDMLRTWAPRGLIFAQGLAHLAQSGKSGPGLLALRRTPFADQRHERWSTRSTGGHPKARPS
jgi:hypothetical protein